MGLLLVSTLRRRPAAALQPGTLPSRHAMHLSIVCQRRVAVTVGSTLLPWGSEVIAQTCASASSAPEIERVLVGSAWRDGLASAQASRQRRREREARRLPGIASVGGDQERSGGRQRHAAGAG